MGTWGTRPFDNDSVLDWFFDVESKGFRVIRKTLSQYLKLPPIGQGDHGRERRSGMIWEEMGWERCADDDLAAIGASEIVAWFAGKPASDPEHIHPSVMDWLQTQRRPHFLPVKKALRCTRAVHRESELRELWIEGAKDQSDTEDWLAKTDDLIRRLEAASSG